MTKDHGDDEDEDGDDDDDEGDDEGDDDDNGVDENDVNYNAHAFGFYKSHARLDLLNRACIWIY